MARPLTRAQQLENTAFLKALDRSGNARGAARAVGVKYGTMQHRRRAHPAFAQAWEVAVAAAHARLHEAGGEKRPSGKGAGGGCPSTTQLRSAVPSIGLTMPRMVKDRPADDPTRCSEPSSGRSNPHRTVGGETVVVRRRDGRLQVRSAQPGKLTRECEQAFLSALSVTANVRLSAAAAGASVAAFYRRRRRNPGFAREMRLALEQGYEAVEMALIASFDPASHADDAWRHNEPPPIPSMTPAQALQLLYLHQKRVCGWDEPPYIERRRGESSEAHSFRLSAMYEARLERSREAFRVAEAAREAAASPHEPPAPRLPALDQVTGWSRAGEGKVHDPDVALFGGWRIEHLKGSKKG